MTMHAMSDHYNPDDIAVELCRDNTTLLRQVIQASQGSYVTLTVVTLSTHVEEWTAM